MSEEELRTELSHPPIPGEHHGVEHLAQQGRAMRRKEKQAAPVNKPPTALPYGITGDLSQVAVGLHLMLVQVSDHTANGTFLQVPEKFIGRALAEHYKARPPRTGVEEPGQYTN